MTKQAVQTPNAPQAIGSYSQAIRAGSTLYLSGQIGLDSATMQLVEGVDAQLNEIMSQYFKLPYPARSAVGVSQLPRGALVEIEAKWVRGEE